METFLAIIRTLNKHRYELVIIPFLTMGLIYKMTSNAPKKYKTEAKLYLNLQEGKGMSLTDEDLKQYQVQTYFTNTIELLKAKKTIEKVRMRAIENAINGTGFFAKGNTMLIKNKESIINRIHELKEGNQFLNPAAFPDSVMTKFLNYHNLTTDALKDIILSFRVMDSNFMKLELTENMPDKVQQLASLFIDALMEENRDLAKSKIKGHKDIIEGLVRQAKADLEAKIKRLENFKVQNNIINLGEHTKAIVVYLVQLEGQRANLQAKVSSSLKGKSEVLNTVQNGNEIILNVSDNAEILKLKDQLRTLNRQMLLNSFEKKTVIGEDVLTKNIQTTKDQIETKLTELTRKTSFDPSRVQLDLVGKYVTYDLEGETSADMVNIINAEIERVTKYSRRFAPFESTVSAYEQDISTAQNAYLVLLNKLNLTQTMEYGSGEDVVEVIDPPYLPTKPEASKRMVIVIAGGLSVFVLMAVIFIVIQLLDASITTVEKYERLSSLPVIAGIPDENPGKRKSHLIPSIELVHHQQLFKLMQNIISHCMGEQSSVILTSSQKEEGKHYLGLQLQTIFSNAGYRVAFVDADWMSPATHDSFINFKDKISHQGLVKNRHEILSSIRKLEEENDLVVIMTSPINLSAEAEFWMEAIKKVIYIFKANRLITKVDKRMEATLSNTRLQFLGTVINKINIENMEDYLGEIPRKRSAIRKYIKKLLTRNF